MSTDDLTDRQLAFSGSWRIGQKRTPDTWSLKPSLTGLLSESPISYIMPPHTAKIGAELCPFPSNLPLELKPMESDRRKDNKHYIQSQVQLKKILGALLFVANEREERFLSSLISADRAFEVCRLPEGDEIRGDVALSYAIALAADGISKIEAKRRELEAKRLSLRDPVIHSDPSEKKRKRELLNPLEEAARVNKERKIINESRKSSSFRNNFSFRGKDHNRSFQPRPEFRNQQTSTTDTYRPDYSRYANGQFRARDEGRTAAHGSNSSTSRGGRGQPRR